MGDWFRISIYFQTSCTLVCVDTGTQTHRSLSLILCGRNNSAASGTQLKRHERQTTVWVTNVATGCNYKFHFEQTNKLSRR